MLFERVFSWLILLFLTPAMLLYFLHYGWFRAYLIKLSILFYVLLSSFVGIVIGLLFLIPSLLKAILKAMLTGLLMVSLILIYSITSIVPYIGSKASSCYSQFEQRWNGWSLISRGKEMRRLMVKVVAESDNHDLKYKIEDEYQTELLRIKRDSKSRLETGETVLSLFLGLILLMAQILNIQIFQIQVFYYPASVLIEAYLLAIAVSIIYRVSILEVLAYSPDHEFNSLEEMDVAIAYQKGISLMNFIQGLTVLVLFVFAVTDVKYSTLKMILENKYRKSMGVTGWLPLAWKTLRSHE